MLRTITLALLFLACTPPVQVPGQLDLALRLRYKPNCGQVPTQYDASCLAALHVITKKAGQVLADSCIAITNRTSDLAGVVQLPPIKLASSSGAGEVVFEVRGIHDNGQLKDTPRDQLCDDNSEVNWLFWGASQPVDLGDYASPDAGAEIIDIRIDCRQCPGGCRSMDDDQCETSLPESYCVPFATNFACNKTCDADSECFEGQIKCDKAQNPPRCNARQTPDDNTGGFCFPCSSQSDCDADYSCVGTPGATGICTRTCPFFPCANDATCLPVSDGLVVKE